MPTLPPFSPQPPPEQVDDTIPVPSIAPTFHYHLRDNFRLGERMDLRTAGPVGCSCEQCAETRRANERACQEQLLREEWETNRIDAEVRVYAANGLHRCPACSTGGSALCPRCRACTLAVESLDVAVDLCVWAARDFRQVTPITRLREAYDGLRAAGMSDAAALHKLVQTYARLVQHCQCYACAPCNTTHARCRVCAKPTECPVAGIKCNCWVCPIDSVRRAHSDEFRRVKCDDCNKYTGCCCKCQRCSSCGARQTSSVRGRVGGLVENRCQSCSKCIDCCSCTEVGTTLPQADGGTHPVYQRGTMKHFPATEKWGLLGAGIPYRGQLNPFKRLIGQELECAGRGTINMNQVVVKKWTGCIVEDGSLPYPTGFEINTAPASGDQYVQQIRDIVAECVRTGTYVNSKCGLHTHIDTSDFNIWSMRRLINLYRRAEPHLFSMLPGTRIGNHYCQPCGESWWRIFNDPGKIHELKTRYVPTELVGADGKKVVKKKRKVEETFRNPASTLKGKLTGALYGYDTSTAADNKARQTYAAEIKRSKSGKDNDTRYRALNVHSWLLRGTLEFRHGAPALELHNSAGAKVPVQGDYIIHWGLVCCGLVEAAARMSDAEVDALGGGKSSAPNANMTWDEFKAVVVPSHLHSWADDTRKVCQTKPTPAAERDTRFNGMTLDCGCRYNGNCSCTPASVDDACSICQD
jgi:hypothetical protein